MSQWRGVEGLCYAAGTSGTVSAVDVRARGLVDPLKIAGSLLFTAGGGILMVVLLNWGSIAALGGGGIEHWIAYPVVLWLVGFGGSCWPSLLPLVARQRTADLRNPDDTG